MEADEAVRFLEQSKCTATFGWRTSCVFLWLAATFTNPWSSFIRIKIS